MNQLSNIQVLAEGLVQAISSLPADEYDELDDALSQQADLNLGDLQSLLNSTNDLLKPEP